MKLILTTAVDHLGAPGDIVEVKDGYARNFLLPRNKAIVATSGAEKQIAAIQRAQQDRIIRDAEHAREVKEALEALTDVTVAVKSAENGKLFGLSRERVRQIEREVMAKLRNGERADRLRSYAS